MKRFLILLLGLSGWACATAQQQDVIDSLKKKLPSLTQDTAIVKTLHNLAYFSADVNPHEAIAYAKQAVAAAEKMHWAKATASSFIQWGNALSNKGDCAAAVGIDKKALALYESIDDKKGVAMALSNIGTAFQRQSNHTEALHFYLKALKPVEELRDTAEIALYNANIAGVFMEQRDIPKALEYNAKAFRLYELSHDSSGMGFVFESRGTIYNMAGQFAESEKWYLKALHLYRNNQKVLKEAIVLSQLGILKHFDFRKGLSYKLQAQQIWDSLAPSHPNAITNTGNLGVAFLDLVRYDSLKSVPRGGIIPVSRSEQMALSEKYLLKAIQLSTDAEDVDNRAFFTAVLSELQHQQGKFKEAYENFRIYFELQDSIYSQENKNKLAALESSQAIELRDKEIALNKQALASERKQRFLLITGILLLLVIGALLWRQVYVRKKTNTTLLLLNNELDEANKVKTKFFSILSHDLRGPVANLINFLHLQQEAPDLVDKASADRHATRITQSAEHLLETMESLLLWSKGQMEQFKPVLSLVAVDALFDDIARHFGAVPGVSFRFENPQHLSLSTDEHYIKTILRNLTGNALKAVQGTPGALIAWKAWEDHGKFFLSISDNGPGISALQLEALYDESSSVGTSKGLGLHLVRDMARAIAVGISVESVPGEGTRFELAL